jgi:hypothetical protein
MVLTGEYPTDHFTVIPRFSQIFCDAMCLASFQLRASPTPRIPSMTASQRHTSEETHSLLYSGDFPEPAAYSYNFDVYLCVGRSASSGCNSGRPPRVGMAVFCMPLPCEGISVSIRAPATSWLSSEDGLLLVVEHGVVARWMWPGLCGVPASSSATCSLRSFLQLDRTSLNSWLRKTCNVSSSLVARAALMRPTSSDPGLWELMLPPTFWLGSLQCLASTCSRIS